jgi:deoxyribodipyrimidine photo-lyase
MDGRSAPGAGTTLARPDPEDAAPCTLVWYESDLRTADHPALTEAVSRQVPVIPVFAWDGGAGWADGAASRWWLHRSLSDLRDGLQRLGLDLVIRRGDPVQVIPDLARALGADRVTWNARPEPDRAARDRRVAEALRTRGVDAAPVRGSLVHDPDSVRTTSGGPYQVFTAFNARIAADDATAVPLPVPGIGKQHRPRTAPETLAPGDLGLLAQDAPSPGGPWAPGEAGAWERLDRFADDGVTRYAEMRDLPGKGGTSRLSPHLHFGEITPAQIRHRLLLGHGTDPSILPFLRQLAWREFAFHLLHHFPETPGRPLRPAFEAFPWRDDPRGLERWQAGQTGYPMVDAGMRELLHTGWMHNRARMVVASFLTKHLLISWTRGAAWFRERLVDADLASNTLGWQWSAGCGADAQPYFRIFNPVLQGTRFDPDGDYVRRWVPELGRLPPAHVHAPWKAPAATLAKAAVVPGVTYPRPIVDHGEARRQALAAYDAVRSG